MLVIAGATVVGWIAAVDEKPWWRWVWDAVSTGFEDTDRFEVDWRLFLSAVALGVAVARWLAGRGREGGGRTSEASRVWRLRLLHPR